MSEVVSWRGRWLIAGVMTLSACATQVDSDRSTGLESPAGSGAVEGEVAVASEQLAEYPTSLSQFFFTSNGEQVTVCFTDVNFNSNAEAALAEKQFRLAIESSWGAVSGLRFTGWSYCPPNPPSSTIPVKLTKVLTNGAFGGFTSPGVGGRLADGYQIDLSVPPDVMRYTWSAVHEMGHALGFGHEHQRADDGGACPVNPPQCATNADCPANSPICDMAQFSGNSAKPGTCQDVQTVTTPLVTLTPYDPESIMNYCNHSNFHFELSPWDVYGAQTRYLARLPAFRQLVTAFDGTEQDNATVATNGGYAPTLFRLSGKSYRLQFPEGWILTNQAPGSVALELWYNSSRGDYVLVANSTTRSEVTNASYIKGSTQGFAYSTSQPGQGLVALQLYWHAGRGDYFTTLAGGAGEQAALAAGYVFKRTEAYVMQNKLPYNVTWNLYSSGLGDNLMTRQAIDSTMPKEALDALNNGYTKVNVDGVTLRYSLPGTRAVHQWWSDSRGDYFATATDAGDNDARTTNYVAASYFEGYVFAAAGPGTVPLRSYYNPSRRDFFTTVEWAAAAAQAGYSAVRIEGNTYTFQP